jgi:hypothetical protein
LCHAWKRYLVIDCDMTGEQAGQEDFALVRKDTTDAILLARKTDDTFANDCG